MFTDLINRYDYELTRFLSLNFDPDLPFTYTSSLVKAVGLTFITFSAGWTVGMFIRGIFSF